MFETTSVCILDYGSGNVRSVYNLFASIHDNVIVSNHKNDIQKASHLVLPGVGAFGSAMEKIKSNLPLSLLEECLFQQKKPFLGICVGMQVLATYGTEFGTVEGLNWIPGSVEELKAGSLPLPHVGWNDIQILEPHEGLFQGLEKHNDFYFVHKYVFKPENKQYAIASTDYGESFCSVIRKDNIMGFQFHPEKSQQAGKKIALNFLAGL